MIGKHLRQALAVIVLLALPAAATAIEMTDYTTPDSRYQEAYLRGGFDSRSGNQDQTSYSYDAVAEYEVYYSTLPRTWRLRFDGQAAGNRGPNDGDDLNDTGSATVNGYVDNYFRKDNKWFAFGSADLGYHSEAEDEFVKVGAGVGYGRVFNATALAKVLRVIEELGESDLINSPVPDRTYIDAAQIVDREREFRSKYGDEEYHARWFAAIEEVLVRDNVLKGGRLSAAGALDMYRVLVDERISVRRHGWLVRTGVGLVVQDYSGETDNDPSLDAVFEWAKPFGYKGQLDNILSYSTVFGNDVDHLVRNALSYSYEITDRIDWVNRWNLTYTIPGGDNVENILTNVVSSGFDYYLTNRVSTGILLGLQWVDDGVDDNGNDDAEFRTTFTIKYRFM